MDLNEYQKEAYKSAGFPDLIIRPQVNDFHDPGDLVQAIDHSPSLSYVYPALGLAGESGETLEKIKKIIRDDRGILTSEKRDAIKKELGDVLWYLATLGTELGFTLEEIALGNIEKLEDRTKRDVLNGSGDDR